MSYALSFAGQIQKPLDHIFNADLHTLCVPGENCMREDWTITRICEICGLESPGGPHRQCVLWEKFQGEAWDGAYKVLEDIGLD